MVMEHNFDPFQCLQPLPATIAVQAKAVCLLNGAWPNQDGDRHLQ